MKMFKKGISPLIATVLIIGFTVALAAIIMTWGTTFSKGMQKSTEATTEEQLACAQDVDIDLSSACVKDANSLTLTLKNDGSKDIEKFSVRMYKDAANVATDTTTLVGAPYLGAYDLKPQDVTIAGPLSGFAGTITLVEIIPVIKIGEKTLTCAATKDYFGDQNYVDELTPCGA